MIKKDQNKKTGNKKTINTNDVLVTIKRILNVIKEYIFKFGKLAKVFFIKLFKRLISFRNPRVYKLRGYTTTSRVDKKVSSEYNQRLLRNILVGAIFALILAIIILLFNPLKDVRELFRILGI